MQQTLRHIAIPNPYAELGIDVDADDSTIRSAFRELAFELHPDRNPRPDAREAFMRVRKAYELVTNPAYKQQREADIIVEQMTNAANEAMRSRTHHAPQATFKRIHIAPEQPILSVFGLAEQKAKLLSLACVAIALCSVMGAGLLGSAVLAALGATVLIGSVFVWMSRNEPSELHVFGSGF
ncbi:MAG: J domain-containing protein [Rubricoccaceae bacterium]|nr:J domain-containing protein [Rubricoccaceae bacterium]